MAGLPKTGTTGQIQLIVGLLLIVAAAILWRVQRAAA
jgi:LPXTG-motif cell wall-anchored protein